VIFQPNSKGKDMDYVFATPHGPVTISIDEDNYTAIAKDQKGGSIGRFEFSFIEGAGHGDDYLKLTHAFLEGCDGRFKRVGIGESILRTARHLWGYPIVAEEDDGIRKSDGSHLTGDAPGFVRAMKRKGVL
jgi:hypothetical protein